MKKQQYFGKWGVVVEFDEVGIHYEIEWFTTKKDAIAKYRKYKKENTLTFIVRQVEI